MVDSDYRLWLVEMNAQPSLVRFRLSESQRKFFLLSTLSLSRTITCQADGSDLDTQIKAGVINGAFDIAEWLIHSDSTSDTARSPLPPPTDFSGSKCALAYSQVYPPDADAALSLEYVAERRHCSGVFFVVLTTLLCSLVCFANPDTPPCVPLRNGMFHHR